MNVLDLGSRVIGREVAMEVVKAFLGASCSGAVRHRRRLDEVGAVEGRLPDRAVLRSDDSACAIYRAGFAATALVSSA